MISVLPLLALAGAVLAKLPPLGGINVRLSDCDEQRREADVAIDLR